MSVDHAEDAERDVLSLLQRLLREPDIEPQDIHLQEMLHPLAKGERRERLERGVPDTDGQLVDGSA